MKRHASFSLAALRRFAVCVFTLLLIACPATYAQSPDDVAIDDSWALQFQITENFTLSSFQGALISAKRQYDAHRALRVGVSLGVNSSRQASEDEATEAEQKDNGQSLRFEAQWIRYPVAEGTARVYWGAGPTARFSRQARNWPIDDREQNHLSIGGGAIGVLGAEWFVHSQVSLMAEYRAGVTYDWTRTKRVEDGSETDNNRTSHIRLGGRGVLAGVSVYF